MGRTSNAGPALVCIAISWSSGDYRDAGPRVAGGRAGSYDSVRAVRPNSRRLWVAAKNKKKKTRQTTSESFVTSEKGSHPLFRRPQLGVAVDVGKP